MILRLPLKCCDPQDRTIWQAATASTMFIQRTSEDLLISSSKKGTWPRPSFEEFSIIPGSFTVS